MDKEKLERLQAEVKEKQEAVEINTLVEQAKELGIDLKEYDLNEDGTPIEDKKAKPKVTKLKVKKVDLSKKPKEGDEKKESKVDMATDIANAIKNAFEASKPTEKKEEAKPIWG